MTSTGLRLFDRTGSTPALVLPEQAVTDALAILGRRGGGKTWTGLGLAEEMLAHGHQIAAIDPTGVWWGLRTNAKGDGPGYPVVVLGGDEADVPLEPTGGELVADLLVDETVSVVLDLSHFRKADRTRFLTAFAERLFHRKGPRAHRTPLHLFVDEAHAFVPQRPQPDQARMLGAGEDLVQMGRSRGIGVTLLSQRPAVVNKNVLSQVAGLVCLQVTATQDRKAIDDWLADTDPDLRKQFVASLSSLGRGEAVVWIPHLDVFSTGKVRGRETFDSSATPAVGEKVTVPTGRAEVDLEVLRRSMADTVERAQANDPKLLRKRIAELEAELAAGPVGEPEVVEKIVEVVPPGLIDGIADGIAEAEEKIVAACEAAIAAALRNTRTLGDAATASATPAPRTPPAVTAPAAPVPTPNRQEAVGEEMTKGAAKILRTLVGALPMILSGSQLAAMAGYSTKSSTWSEHLGALRRFGYLDAHGDLVEATPAGVAASGVEVGSAPVTHAGLLSAWRDALPDGARRLLDVLVEIHPAPMDRPTLFEAAGYSPTSSTPGEHLAILRRNRLVETVGSEYRASSVLWP